MSTDLKNDITAMIAQHFEIDIAKLSAETEIASLGIDSLSMIEFMFQMEEKFNIQMADTRAPLTTVADVVAEIESAIAAQSLPQAA